ncbi:LOW QUALITY PROTEIN: hypothetical protein ColTof4_07540 [Colletotrichum tofieldiae]|nr:LOW QUALITY PROTEIN: hypothetical protein ColTof3_12492 [Colletotrichum tofieldiae]GKT75117.1 LOW QUALITY PROTEIN: hypothetical protein ColTof4_07540 [Colletotrichum tofieldiae]GKT92351.1 LOW QUALITY PROTEIN: hypothetical protein Ct61P_10201 [Colletotrichum tofieldiae]
MPALTLAISCFQPNDENEIHTNSYPVSPVGLFYSKSSAASWAKESTSGHHSMSRPVPFNSSHRSAGGGSQIHFESLFYCACQAQWVSEVSSEVPM